MTPAERQNQEKQAAAVRAASYVENGMTVGLGTGTTAARLIRLIGEKVRAGLKIRGVATSLDTDRLAREQGIPMVTLADAGAIDLTLDGADEVDPRLNLIKGGGGALLREKVVASSSRRLIIMADSSKRVEVLGAFPLPIAVVPFAVPLISRRIQDLGATVKFRSNPDGQPFLSDDGLSILDCAFGKIGNPEELSQAIACIPGVADHGLFLGLAHLVIFAEGDRITEVTRP